MNIICPEIDKSQHSDLFDQIVGFDIRPYTSLVRFEAEEIIMQEGEMPEYLYYLLNGRAKLFLPHENGRITLINFLTPPCFIGEMELLEQTKTADSVQALTVCECYRINLGQCRAQLLEDTKFLRYLCCLLSAKAARNTTNYSKNQTYPLKNRLAAFILETAVDGRYREQHTEVAELLGVTYRHLLYVFAQLVKDGMIERTQSGYRILNEEKLRQIAR